MDRIEKTIEFSTPVEKRFSPEIRKKIFYISEQIVDFALLENDEHVYGVKLYLTSGENLNQIANYIQILIQRDIIGLKNIKPNRVWDEDSIDEDGRFPCSEFVIEYLQKNGYLHEHGDGQISIKEPYVDLIEFFDDLFESISNGIFKSERYIFPTLLKTNILNRAGYFDSFPNLLMFVVRLKNSIENFDSFKKEFQDGTTGGYDPKKILKFICETEYSLPPTMCYYVYDMLSGEEFPNNRSLTAKGKSFRFENKYHQPLKRLWDFTIRETVFIGDHHYVQQNVHHYRDVLIQFFRRIGMRGYCETANDPFFLVENNASRINAQKMVGSKYELHLRINRNETVAAASFNLHSQYLSKKFCLYKSKENHEFAYTGCVGIGLERVFLAFLSQFGVEEENWPQLVRDLLNERRSRRNGLHEQLKKALFEGDSTNGDGNRS